MSLSRSLRRLLSIAFVLASLSALASDLGTVSGVVRSLEGEPIQGAIVTLSSDRIPSISAQSITGKEGNYKFAGLGLGGFHLSAAFDGYTSPPPQMAVISSAMLAIKIDFTLARRDADPAAKNPIQPEPPPKFEAAGVRGLIDPGGYSAPAQAAAASGLIKGMADIKRADKDLSSSMDSIWPCRLGPSLVFAVKANPGSARDEQRLGNFYAAHNQSGRAISLLRQAHQMDLSDDAITKDLATALLKNAQFDDARKLLSTMAEKERDPELHQLLAQAAEGSGMFVEAAREYQIAADQKPTEDNLFGVGYERILAGLPAEAATAFQSGLQQYPRSVKLLIGAGTAAFLQSRTSDGILHFLQATDLDPVDPRPYPFLASASGMSSAEMERVRNCFKRFLEIAPSHPEAYYFYALILWNERAATSTHSDLPEIEKLLKRAIELDARFARAHFLLANLYAEREDFQGATREYEITLGLAPDLRDAHYRLSSAYRRMGQTAPAAKQMQQFAEARERESSSPDSGISIQQFVSVLTPSGPQAGAQNPSCPDATP